MECGVFAGSLGKILSMTAKCRNGRVECARKIEFFETDMADELCVEICT